MADPEQAQVIENDDEENYQTVTGHFRQRAILKGHQQWVTSLQVNSEHDQLVSASRDNTALVWRLPKQHENWGTEYIRLIGHNHFVTGVSFSSDSSHLLTSSWDKTIRLWDLTARQTKTLFLDHKKDVLDVTFSPCNRRIISVSRDKTVKIWNILGECKVTLSGDSWATTVACAPMVNDKAPLIIAVGYWDGSVRLWSISEKCEELFPNALKNAHNGRVASLTFTPDGQWLVSGGSDRKVVMWSVANGTKTLSFTAPAPVHAIAACPSRAWICAATYEGIAVWDIQEKTQIDLVQPKFEILGKHDRGRTPDCTCISWAEDGSVLYAGYNNGEIRVWEVRSE